MEIVIAVASFFASLLCLLFQLMIRSKNKQYYIYCLNDSCFRNVDYTYKNNKKCVKLKHGTTLFGRSNGVDIIIDDNTISRIQFYISNTNDSCNIVNLHGINPLYVNGKEVEDKQTLSNGDIIKAGNVQMRIMYN